MHADICIEIDIYILYEERQIYGSLKLVILFCGVLLVSSSSIVIFVPAFVACKPIIKLFSQLDQRIRSWCLVLCASYVVVSVSF